MLLRLFNTILDQLTFNISKTLGTKGQRLLKILYFANHIFTQVKHATKCSRVRNVSF